MLSSVFSRLSSAALLCAALFGASCAREQPTDLKPTSTAPVQASAPEPTRSVATLRANGQLGPGRGTLLLGLEVPEMVELSAGAPLRVSGRSNAIAFPEKIRTQLDPKALPLRIPVDVADGATGPIWLDLTFYYCTKGDSASCLPENVRFSVDLDLSGEHPGGEALITYRLRA